MTNKIEPLPRHRGFYQPHPVGRAVRNDVVIEIVARVMQPGAVAVAERMGAVAPARQVALPAYSRRARCSGVSRAQYSARPNHRKRLRAMDA